MDIVRCIRVRGSHFASLSETMDLLDAGISHGFRSGFENHSVLWHPDPLLLWANWLRAVAGNWPCGPFQTSKMMDQHLKIATVNSPWQNVFPTSLQMYLEIVPRCVGLLFF